jgi:hypothetical protein
MHQIFLKCFHPDGIGLNICGLRSLGLDNNALSFYQRT